MTAVLMLMVAALSFLAAVLMFLVSVFDTSGAIPGASGKLLRLLVLPVPVSF